MQAQHPYSGYRLYKVFHKREGRYYAVLFRSNSDRTTIAWAKYVLEVKLGRKLRDGYEAHHRDENPLNDEGSNLEESERSAHKRHHGRLQHDRAELRHGTVSAYIRGGCRCDFCKAAKRDYYQKRLASSVGRTRSS